MGFIQGTEIQMEQRSGASPPAEDIEENIDLLACPALPRGRAMGILTSPEVMADFFRTRLPWLFPPGSILKECRPRVLRDRLGSRQVVSYRLVLADQAGRKAGPMMVVLKRYADEAEGKKTYAAMRMLWENGFGHGSKLKISEPFCYLEELRFLVLGKARGMLLRNNLYQSGPVALARMKAVARWLAKLHHLDAGFEGIALHPDEESSIRVFVDEMGGREHRPFLPKLEELASLVLARLSFFGDVAMTPVHGDFQCENIFVDNDNVTVVDFDKFCRSDPARDLGYIIAQMRAMAFLVAAPGSVNEGLRAFWEEYLAAAAVAEREAFSARTTLFAARKCLQNIYYMAYVLPGEGMAIVEILLDEAERFARAERVEEVLDLPIAAGH